MYTIHNDIFKNSKQNSNLHFFICLSKRILLFRPLYSLFNNGIFDMDVYYSHLYHIDRVKGENITAKHFALLFTLKDFFIFEHTILFVWIVTKSLPFFHSRWNFRKSFLCPPPGLYSALLHCRFCYVVLFSVSSR